MSQNKNKTKVPYRNQNGVLTTPFYSSISFNRTPSIITSHMKVHKREEKFCVVEAQDGTKLVRPKRPINSIVKAPLGMLDLATPVESDHPIQGGLPDHRYKPRVTAAMVQRYEERKRRQAELSKKQSTAIINIQPQSVKEEDIKKADTSIAENEFHKEDEQNNDLNEEITNKRTERPSSASSTDFHQPETSSKFATNENFHHSEEQKEEFPKDEEGTKNQEDSFRTETEPVQQRGYMALMDEFSLHHIVMKKGRTVINTPEFESFARTYKDYWSRINEALIQFEDWAEDNALDLLFVDGKKIADFALSEWFVLSSPSALTPSSSSSSSSSTSTVTSPASSPSSASSQLQSSPATHRSARIEYARLKEEQMLSCLVNIDAVQACLRQPGQRFKQGKREDKAATAIQSVVRMWLARCRYHRESPKGKAATVIQRRWKTFQTRQWFLQKLEEIQAEREEKCLELQRKLCEEWDIVKQSKRVHIHLPSLGWDERIRRSIDTHKPVDLKLVKNIDISPELLSQSQYSQSLTTDPTNPSISSSSSSPSSSSHFNSSAEETLFHLFPSLENGELSRLVDLSDPNVDVVFVSPVELPADVVGYLKKLLVAGAAQQSSLRSAPSSSSSSSTGAARRSTSPFRRRRSEEKKSSENEQPSSSSAPAIDPSDASAVAASYTSAGAMDDIERRLRIVVPEAAGVYGRHMPLSLQLLLSPRALQTLRGYVVARRAVLYGGVACAYDVALSAMLSVPLVAPLPSLAASVGTKSGSKRIFAAADVNAFPSIYDLFDPSLLPSAIARLVSRSPQSRRVVVKLDDEVMGRGIAVCEVGGIVEKGLDAAGLRMEDVVLSPAAIALAVLEEREEAEEGEKGGKNGEEKGEEKGEDGRREGGDGNEEKGGYPTAHREFVEKIKENQGKLEEAMAPLVVEALGLSGLRFVKAETEVGADKQYSVEPEVCSSSPSDGIQQENRRAEEEAADGSLGLASDGREENVGKDEEHVEMSANDLGMNEESGREGGSIDLEKEEEEEEEEGQILDVESLLSVPAHPECVTLVDESAYGSWRDYLVTMTVTGALVELCAERERIVGKPVVEGMIQPDGTMSITFIGERLFGRREKRREGGVGIGVGMGVGGGGCLASDGVSLHLSSDRQRERMDEFVAIGAVVPQESVPSIALRDATYAIGQVCHGKGMIGVFSVSYCVFVDEWESLRMCAVDLSVGPLAASSAFRWMSYLLQGGIEIASGNYLLPRRGGTAALHVRAPSSDSAHSACARPQGCSSGAHRSTSPRQVAGVQRVSPQAVCGSASASAQACACLSPAATRSFVIVQPFYQPELSRVPHGQFFSNCREHNITFDFEGKCGVLFQLAGHLIAGVVGFVACERSVELAARTAARALETVAVQMLHCAFVSALSWEEKKRMEKRVYGENGAVARGTALGRLAGLGGGLVKSAREKGDLAKAGLNDRSRIGAAVPLKVPFGQLQRAINGIWRFLEMKDEERMKQSNAMRNQER